MKPKFSHPLQYANSLPNSVAFLLLPGGEKVSYSELHTRSMKLAWVLRDIGVEEGETICIWLKNQKEYPEIAWAGKNSGLRYVAMSAHLNASDACYIIKDSGARLLIASDQFDDEIDVVAAECPELLILRVDDGRNHGTTYEKVIQNAPRLKLDSQKRGASMLYSSGTTGRPKGIRTEIANVSPLAPPGRFDMLKEKYGFDQNTVFLNPAPFYHAAPLRFMMAVQRAGGSVIGLKKFDAELVLKAIEQYRITHGFFVPTMFSRMLSLPETVRRKYDLSSMRHAIHSAAPCPRPVKYKMIDWWGPVIEEVYSGTESIGHTFISSQEWLKYPGSVGKAAGNCRIRIVDQERRPLPAGEIGVIEMSNGLSVDYFGRAADQNLKQEDGFGLPYRSGPTALLVLAVVTQGVMPLRTER